MGQPIPVTTLQYDQPVGPDQGAAFLMQALMRRQGGQADPAMMRMQEAEMRRQQEQADAEAFVQRALVAQQMRALGAELAYQPVVESPLYKHLMTYRKP